MKNTTLFIIIVIVLALVGFLLYTGTTAVTGNIINDNSNSINDNSNDNNLENAQKIVLGMKNYNYFPSVINVKAGLPVEITLDETVRGCLRSFSLSDLGISKFSQNPSQKIVFTPTQIGSFKFSCSMGMGYGTMNVG